MSVIWQPTLDNESTRWRDIAVSLTRAHFAPNAAEIDREQRFPAENVSKLFEHRLGALFIPKEYGGEGASITATAAVVEAVGTGCASTAAVLCVYQLGSFPILLGGNEEQKRFYLGEVAKGVLTSFALSERTTGSDAAAIETRAVRTGDSWRLKGEKYWIGGGGTSRYYVVFAKTDPAAGGRGISAFIVDEEQPGVIVDELCDKMGVRGSPTSNLKLDTVVPDEARVGPENQALRLSFQALNVGRIMVAAQCLGLALACYDEASRRAVDRRAFGNSIIDYQGIGFKLADMATEISAARMMLYEAAKAYDERKDVTHLSAMCKLYASEVAHRAADTAMQVWGARGYCKPSAVERFYRDQRISEIYEGTSEIQRLVLARAVRKEVEESL
ncbi:acyl-CoA dehydrogenase family protein [Mycobacterium sp. MMS18-G62]